MFHTGFRFNIFFFVFCLLCVCFFSCSNSPFPDFSKTKNGLYYKIIDIGDSDKRPKPGDYVTAQIIIKSEKDSILYDTRTIGLEGAVTFILDAPQYEKDYREGFQYLSEGDSAVFITDAYSLFLKKNHTVIPKGMTMDSPVKTAVRVLKIRTPEEHAKDMEKEKSKQEQAEFEEKKILEKYMADSSISARLIGNGMYYIKIREGNGLTPDSARVALLNYRGSFLNGRCFDFFSESQPFEWMVGQEDQLIKGLDIGVRRMHEGEKAEFIIPSHLAYGSSGSAYGIVPPFTTVIYEVELLKVQ